MNADTTRVRIGTRKSQLAMLQTEAVMAQLRSAWPGIELAVQTVTTSGDRVLNKPIADLGGRGVFVKELEEALLADEVDLVVHSMKDLPTDLPEGLTLACVTERQDPRDVLVSKDGVKFANLQVSAKVATSSRRRVAQLRSVRDDLEYVDIRGNIPTRLSKHDNGACDAMILAAAGLIRLTMTERISEYFSTDLSIPAAGQGALAVECRQNDNRVLELLQKINDEASFAEVTAERSFLDTLGGGCSVPIGALAKSLPEGELEIKGCVASLDGKDVLRHKLQDKSAQARELGRKLAGEMVTMGAGRILAALKEAPPPAVSPP